MARIPVLRITCGSTDCSNGRHAFNDRRFKVRSHGRKFLEPGVCKCCGADPVDWARLHRRDASDIEFTIGALQTEFIRWDMWTRPFSDDAVEHARALGPTLLRAEAQPTIERVVGPVATGHWDYMKVPTDQGKMTSPIQYALHAVAACCRKCVALWHGIPNERRLDRHEISYLSQLVSEFLDRRVAAECFNGN